MDVSFPQKQFWRNCQKPSDQSGCSLGLLEGIREELIGVLSRYMEFDSGKVDLCLTRMECAGTKEPVPALSARIPIRRFTDMRKE